MDRETGIDLPAEAEGTVPDEAWLDAYCEGIESEGCDLGWLPGYTVNMSIGQGDLVVTPMQMAVTTAAIANGGNIVIPRLAARFERETLEGVEVTREIEPVIKRKLPLDATEIGVIQQGLIDVVSGSEGTARGAFAGFPLDEFPVAGKTGTAQLRTEDNNDNDAWFVSYAPATDPQYVIATYVEKTSLHGGSIAAPIAREIYEAILGLDEETEVQVAEDQSG
jgi:penicillin-binding protein 2